MTRITSAIAAALIASASFATAALAEGNYYEGVTPPSAGQQHPATHQNAQGSASYGYTGSVSNAQGSNQSFDGTVTLDRGDYYEGAVRPN
ncbi:hypothetical protein [Neorhizobium galegae]|uniref:Uncharacterized protein n=1 Tax=Neorhizobium galegae bv. officinalis TaxID=323656 RepID=A0A0T7H026_NEOGA|nr:hypothetical protein [Neorhizobium galegae]CDZ52904.1 Hypothetical protein NGAL_HAMBI1189_47170 [Neorhizobium galegae bv. officinalis]